VVLSKVRACGARRVPEDGRRAAQEAALFVLARILPETIDCEHVRVD
jgi:hypothetical protein